MWSYFLPMLIVGMDEMANDLLMGSCGRRLCSIGPSSTHPFVVQLGFHFDSVLSFALSQFCSFSDTFVPFSTPSAARRLHTFHSIPTCTQPVYHTRMKTLVGFSTTSPGFSLLGYHPRNPTLPYVNPSGCFPALNTPRQSGPPQDLYPSSGRCTGRFQYPCSCRRSHMPSRGLLLLEPRSLQRLRTRG